MRKVCAHADIVMHVIGEVQGLLPISQSEARDIVFELTGAHEADLVSFGTEAGLFQSIGMSAVSCGPGSIAQAHKPNEYIEIAQLDTCLRMLTRLQDGLSS
ncbi:MAG: M20/M25/M40 family metallo-hydrolase [Rhizobiaceae bacterium]|nr:M20/M25/M40 family metallo-hydrolase [Rhizobiaceae bacterium]